MGYRVADDEAIVAALRSVLDANKSIVSQRLLGDLALAELRQQDKEVSVTSERVRRLAAIQKFVRLEVRTRRGPREKVLNRCPVCGTALGRLKNQTLFGGEVTLTLRCPQCHYSTGKRKRIPTLYVFHWRGPSSRQDQPELMRGERR
ncbi:MAG TPA: hypothetical protein VI818_06150 [Candidatus Thermoplasmatota archaeon]|nr:hypothetical protein [Candidatus Thermoplasmatota archaeon]